MRFAQADLDQRPQPLLERFGNIWRRLVDRYDEAGE